MGPRRRRCPSRILEFKFLSRTIAAKPAMNDRAGAPATALTAGFASPQCGARRRRSGFRHAFPLDRRSRRPLPRLPRRAGHRRRLADRRQRAARRSPPRSPRPKTPAASAGAGPSSPRFPASLPGARPIERFGIKRTSYRSSVERLIKRVLAGDFAAGSQRARRSLQRGVVGERPLPRLRRSRRDRGRSRLPLLARPTTVSRHGRARRARTPTIRPRTARSSTPTRAMCCAGGGTGARTRAPRYAADPPHRADRAVERRRRRRGRGGALCAPIRARMRRPPAASSSPTLAAGRRVLTTAAFPVLTVRSRRSRRLERRGRLKRASDPSSSFETRRLAALLTMRRIVSVLRRLEIRYKHIFMSISRSASAVRATARVSTPC